MSHAAQEPLHYAFVASAEPLQLPRTDAESTTKDDGGDDDESPTPAQDALVSLYQSYAERFPNPRLIEEYQERDQLLQATSAAHSAASSQKRQPQQSQGWFASLFGGSTTSGKEPSIQERLQAARPPDDEEAEDDWLEYTEVNDETEDASLCGTHHHSLDRSCIPTDAHSMARLLLASQRTRGERPHVVRSSPQFPCDSTFCIVGLGVIAEYSSIRDNDDTEEEHPYSQCTTTSDRDDLIKYAKPRGFDLSLVRAVSLGPNFLLVSWGFRDGIVVFYRRIALENSSIAWEAAVFMGPSQAVLEHSFDLFAEEEDGDEDTGSDLLRVTDMVPLVLVTPGVPAAALVVSRLGGYMEVLPLPPSLWHGAILPPARHNPRTKKRSKQHQPHHYAKKYLVNVASDKVPIPIMALTTTEYHIDIISLEAIRTRLPMNAIWDQELYGKAPPPAEFILVASGTQAGHEILTFWSISFVFETEPPHPDSAGFTLRALLQEALDVEAMGADLSVFANRAILNQWRQPRKVALKEQPPQPIVEYDEDGEIMETTTITAETGERVDDSAPPSSVYDRVTTITTSAPIVAMEAIVVPLGFHEDGTPILAVMLSLLDWNGSVTVMDCSLLERMVSHSLSEEEYRIIHDADMVAQGGDDNPPPPIQIPLVKTIIDRSRTMLCLKRGNKDSPRQSSLLQCVNVQWLARAEDPSDPWLVLLASSSTEHKKSNSSQVMILSGLLQMEETHPEPVIQTVPFPTSNATLQGSTVVEFEAATTLAPLKIVFPTTKRHQSDRLCLCLLQPLQPHDIIQQLAHDTKYDKAIEASQQLNDEERQLVAAVLEECRQKLWEATWDMQWLKQVTNGAYIIQQAFSLFASSDANPVASGGEEQKFDNHDENDDMELLLQHVDLEKCREICALALERTSKIRLASALTLGQGGGDVKGKLQSIMVRLGTYELLCQTMNAEASFYKFCQYFVHVSMVDLAKSLAPVANLAALSILWFRHHEELKPCFLEILQLLPLSISPRDYCFLLPVLKHTPQQDPDRTDLFITEIPPSESDLLLHASQLPLYLKETMGFNVVLNVNDEKMVLECNSNANQNDNGNSFDSRSLLAFFESRATDMQLFVGNLEHVADFCATSLLALGASLEAGNWHFPGAPNAENGSAHGKLVCTWGSAMALQRMLQESLGDSPVGGGDIDLSPFATVTPLDLWSMATVDVVGMVLGGQDDSETIYQIYKQHLVPLLRYLPNGPSKCLDQAISDYCINVIKKSSCNQTPSVNGDMSTSEIGRAAPDGNDDTFLDALRLCAAVAFGSRTIIKKSDRIIQDKSTVVELVHKVIEESASKCRGVAMPKEDYNAIVELMWKMYESLPVNTSSEQSSQSDCLYQTLVGLQILSQWPDCQEEAFLFLSEKIQVSRVPSEKQDDHDKSLLLGQTAISRMCRSFCSQAKNAKGAVGLSDLLRDLTSDLEQFYKICYSGDESFLPVIVETLSSELVAPLSRKANFELVAQLLTSVDKTWWDHEEEARIIKAYVDSIVFADADSDFIKKHCGEDTSVQAAITCQDAMGPVFPDLQEGFQLSRRYLDAASFINTQVFAELKVSRTIKPNDLREDPPLDVVEAILKALPKAIIIKCMEWGDESLAVQANKALRSFQESQGQSPDHAGPKALPPIPGGAMFHLAGILGLEDGASALAVKSRVVHYGVASGLFGASAAVCRTMLHDTGSFSTEADAVARISAIAEVVARPEYADMATKAELCLEALRRFQRSTSVHNCQPLDDILKVYTALEPRINQSKQNESQPPILNLSSPSDSIGCLYHDSWGQYSVNIYDLLWTFRLQAVGCSIDDTLLNAICRYVFFSCIFRSTRPRSVAAGQFEKATANQLLIFGAALLLQMHDWPGFSAPAIKELRQIVEKQTIAIINQHPKAFQDPFTMPDENIVRQLVGRGFPPVAAQRSALATNNVGVQQALQWGVANAKDPRMQYPIFFLASAQTVFVDKALIQQVMDTFAFAQKFLSGTKDISRWTVELAQSSSKETGAQGVGIAFSKTEKGAIVASDGPKQTILSHPEPTTKPRNPTASETAPAQPFASEAKAERKTESKPQIIPPAPSASVPIAKPPAPVPPPTAPVASPAGPWQALKAPPKNVAPANDKPPPTKTTVLPSSKAQAMQPPPSHPTPVPQTENLLGQGKTLNAPRDRVAPIPTQKPQEELASKPKPPPPNVNTQIAQPPPPPSASFAVASSTAPSSTLKINTGQNAAAMKTGETPTSTTNSFVTPTNHPTGTHLGQSTGSASDRSTLKQRGEAALGALRSTPRSRQVDLDERKRLIEAGRRLLAKSRARNIISPTGSSASPAIHGSPSISNGHPIGDSSGASPGVGESSVPEKASASKANAEATGTTRYSFLGSKLASTSESVAASAAETKQKPPPPPAPKSKDDTWGFDDESDKKTTLRAPPASSIPLKTQLPTTVSSEATLGSAPKPFPPAAHPAGTSHSSMLAAHLGLTAPKVPSNSSVPPPPPAPALPPPKVAPAVPPPPAMPKTAPKVVQAPARPPPSAPTLSTSMAVAIVPAVEVSDNQGGWDFDGSIDDLGDSEGGSASAPVPPAPAPVPSLPPAPATFAASEIEPSENENEGNWAWDDGLGDLDDDPMPAAPVPAPAPVLAAPAPTIPTGMAGVGIAQIAQLDASVSEGQGAWDFDADDIDGLEDIDDEPTPEPPQAVAAAPAPSPAPAVSTSTANLDVANQGSGGGWGFDGDEDGLGDLEGGESGGGWGFDDETSGHPIGNETTTQEAGAVTKLTPDDEDDGGGWDFDDF